MYTFIKPKKVVLFPEIGEVKIFLSLTRPHSRMCIRIIIFCFKKTHTGKQKAGQTKQKKRKTKETKEEKEKENFVVLNSDSGKSNVIRYRLRICSVHF